MLFLVKLLLFCVWSIAFCSLNSYHRVIWIVCIEVINILLIVISFLLGGFFGDPLYLNFALSIMVLGAVEFVLYSIIYVCFFLTK